MDYWFFLSYARRDNIGEEYLKRFYKELAREVAGKAGLRPDVSEAEIGFFDTIGVGAGDHWPDAMATALQTSRAFVCLFSRGYFNSEYCGKEFQVFLNRLESHARPRGIKIPPLILPILWDSPDRLPKALPKVISDIQYTHDIFGQVYSKEGLNFVMRLQKYKDDYEEFKIRFAEKLVREAEAVSLPPLRELEPLSNVKSAFHTPEFVSTAQSLESSGPRYVQFVFVAARRDEFRAAQVRQSLDCYGEEGGMDWHPYLPDVTDEVALLAQEVALAEKLRYEALPLNANIIQQLEEADRRNKIVAIIVDTWTLRLEHYHTFMRNYDDRSFLNCVVLVPWNNKDDETRTSRIALEDAVKRTFINRAISKDPNYFLDWISSPNELKKELSVALNKARMRIVEKSQVIRKAESARVIVKPVLPVPGATV